MALPTEKTFNGKTYSLDSRYARKIRARERAQDVRRGGVFGFIEGGASARVVNGGKESLPFRYGVYVRHKKGVLE